MTPLATDFTAPHIEYGKLAPLLIVFGIAALGVLVEAFTPRKQRYPIQLGLGMVGLLAALAATIVDFVQLDPGDKTPKSGHIIAEGAIDIVQIDSCRMGGLNEVLAVLLIAAKFGLPVWPHAGGVGLCEYVQHLSMIDYVSVSGTKEGRVIEYVDHLHEHFLDPCRIENAAYMPPSMPGFSIEMKPETLSQFQFAATKASTGDSRPA